jgi:hypothetical protein
MGAITLGRDSREVSEQFFVGEPESIRCLLRQLDPVRTLHRLFGPEMTAFLSGCDDPGMISPRYRGRFRITAPGDARYRFELLYGRKYVLTGQVSFKLRTKTQRFISVEELNVFDARIEAGPRFGIDEQRPDRFRRGSDLKLVSGMTLSP